MYNETTNINQLNEEKFEELTIRFLNTILKNTDHKIEIKSLCPNLLKREDKEYAADFVGLTTEDKLAIINFNRMEISVNEMEDLTILAEALNDKYGKDVEIVMIVA